MEHVAIIVFWMFFTLVVPIYVYRDATNKKIAYPERWGLEWPYLSAFSSRYTWLLDYILEERMMN